MHGLPFVWLFHDACVSFQSLCSFAQCVRSADMATGEELINLTCLGKTYRYRIGSGTGLKKSRIKASIPGVFCDFVRRL